MAFNLFQNQPIANKSVLPNFAEEYNKPQSLAAKLLEAQLKNKHDSIINQYLPRSEEARINATESNTGLDAFRQMLMEAQAGQVNRSAQMPVLSPYDKIRLELAAKKANTEQSENLKEERSLEESYPESESLLKNIDRALEITAKHPEWYGAPTPFLSKFTGSQARKRNINDPEYGELEATLGQLVGPQAQALSGNRILASALGLAQNIKPGLDENKEIAYGKLMKIRKELFNSLSQKQKRYEEHGGQKHFGNYTGFQPKTSFKNETEFNQYMKTLTPHQRNLVQIAKNHQKSSSSNNNRPSSYSQNDNQTNKIKWIDIRHTAQKRGLTENDVIDALAKKSGITVDEFMKRIEAEN